jgi:hypothetical protein
MGPLVAGDADHNDPPQRVVGEAVSTPIEPVVAADPRGLCL